MTCECAGREHVVCRTWSVLSARDLLARYSTPISDPPARPKLFDCGCHGAMHPVCDPAWKRYSKKPDECKPVRPMTLKQALASGLTLRPHVTHLYRDQGAGSRVCDCGAEMAAA
jgi:hypothetical protein